MYDFLFSRSVAARLQNSFSINVDFDALNARGKETDAYLVKTRRIEHNSGLVLLPEEVFRACIDRLYFPGHLLTRK